MNVDDTTQIEQVVQEIDRLITEMTAIRSQLERLRQSSSPQPQSVKSMGYFGMWSDRDDMRGLSSREWLNRLRNEQWARP